MVPISEWVSNCPISRPINVGLRVDWDMNGLLWNHEYGFFFAPVDEMLPIRPPAQRWGF